MQTWRARPIDDDLPPDRRMALMRESAYVRTCSRVLSDAVLQSLVMAKAQKLVFVPLSNLLPYLDAFAIPAHVTVARKGESMQHNLVRCCAF